MSRIRTIKPEFWTSGQVMACSPQARLLFIGLWNFCDDHGVHPASLMRLKAKVFPGDSFTTENISQWITELIHNKLIYGYVVDGQSYWIVTGWGKHQRIDKPTYRHPLPLPELKDARNLTSFPRDLSEASVTSLKAVGDGSTTDRNGMESNGLEKETCEVETSPRSDSPLNDIHEVFKHWQTVMGHPSAKLDKKRQRAIGEALNLGYTLGQLKQAIDGCFNTPFNQGQNDRGQRYDDIGLILRDAAHIDRFIANAIAPPLNRLQESLSMDCLKGAI